MHQKKPAIFAVMASLLALAVAISWTLWKLLPQKAGITKGIAVLPFENLSPDPHNAYFTESIHEEILARLATIHDSNWAAIFRVTSRRILRSTLVHTPRRIETYEPSRQRNNNYNFPASPSLVWARRSVAGDGMARAHGNPK